MLAPVVLALVDDFCRNVCCFYRSSGNFISASMSTVRLLATVYRGCRDAIASVVVVVQLCVAVDSLVWWCCGVPQVRSGGPHWMVHSPRGIVWLEPFPARLCGR